VVLVIELHGKDGAKVATVKTSITHGKMKRQGRFEGQRSDWKKAWVRLRDEGARREGAAF